MYTHRLAVRCVNDPVWVDEFLKYVDENPNSCQEVWFCSSYAFPPIEKHREFARGMKPAVEKFRSRGIRVALQISNTIGGHSGTLNSDCTGLIRDDWHAQYIVGSEGQEFPATFCARSKEFTEYVQKELEAYLTELPDVCGVWIDDDFRMGNHNLSCWCDNCIAEFSERQGKKYTREELVALVNDDFEIRDAWIQFTKDRLYDAAKMMAEAVHKYAPNAYMALQHGAFGYMQGCGQTAAFEGFMDGSGIAPHSRPGGGSYEDYDPNTFIRKWRWLSHQTRYLPEYVKDIRPEIENLPDVAYGKTMAGLAFETAFYFAGGATSMSYATMMRRNEPLSWLCLQLRDMSENFEWFSRLSEINKNSHPDGIEVYISEKPWNYKTEKPFAWEQIYFDDGMEMMRDGIPLNLNKIGKTLLLNKHYAESLTDDEIRTLLSKNVVCDGESVTILTQRGFGDILGVTAENIKTGKLQEKLNDEYNWSFNFFKPYGAKLTLSDRAKEVTTYTVIATGETYGTASAYTETTLGGRWAVIGYGLFNQIISFAKRNAVVEAMEWAGGQLPAKLTTPDRVILYPRSNDEGKLLAVSLVNTTIGKCIGTEIVLKGEYHEIEWRALHVPTMKLEGRVENGSTYVTIPDFDPWSVGTLFLDGAGK